MDTKNAILSFNPNDFFYYNSKQTPNDEECKKILDENINCNDNDSILLNDDKCLKQSLCINKKKAQSVFQQGDKLTPTLRMKSDLVSDIRIDDMNELYNIEKQRCLNYSLGIGIISIFILQKIFIFIT